ncbi:hypothetical protein N1F89_16995 [Aquibium sp. A9E412]|nr:hypothetical protein [Aquibium sp. A9E412]MDN2567922.1 hypothetical protein [Aquibium sp. A9E412]
MADQHDEFFDDDAGRLPEGAGVILCLVGAGLFWLGLAIGVGIGLAL